MKAAQLSEPFWIDLDDLERPKTLESLETSPPKAWVRWTHASSTPATWELPFRARVPAKKDDDTEEERDGK